MLIDDGVALSGRASPPDHDLRRKCKDKRKISPHPASLLAMPGQGGAEGAEVRTFFSNRETAIGERTTCQERFLDLLSFT